MNKNKEEKVKEKRKEIIQFLKDERITYFEWNLFIKRYINQKYEESTL